MRRIVLAASIALVVLVPSSASSGSTGFEARSLDGSGNNAAHATWGQTNTRYPRVASVTGYTDGISKMVSTPAPRYVSNRIFNDIGQNVFSENNVSQWGWLWGQFLDHTFGLRDETPAESVPIPFSSTDPLERFKNDFPSMGFARTPAAPGTGVTSPRQQINTVSSYIDAFSVYGGTQGRLDWLLDGGGPSLFLPDRFLPRERDKANPPAMDLMGPLTGNGPEAAVAGDVRANENIGLTAVHTLFAREHNRIVSLLPNTLSDEDKFQIARRVVGAEEQYITYNEFLPALGVPLAPYPGYQPTVDASISNEFATVGYRAHSQIHGEMEPDAPGNRYTAGQLAAFAAEGIQVEHDPGETKLVIPLDLTFGAPQLLQDVGVGPLLRGLANEREYRNDEQIDDSLRSILFGIPKTTGIDPATCGEPVVNPNCFSVVQDLGAIDVQRGRDHGMPSYNDLRAAYGLPRRTTFTGITGEATDAFPAGIGIDDAAGLGFTSLLDAHGNPVTTTEGLANDVVTATRRAPLAARLKALYGSVDAVDAFVGMVSEPHLPGSEFGELQLAMWKKQFEALRDGDRFYYANDPALASISSTYRIDYRQTLAHLIEANTGVQVQDNVFKAPAESDAPKPAPGLVAAYGFDEGAGTTAADASGHGNNGVTANTTWLAAGKFGGALSFGGSSSFVKIPDAGSLDLPGALTLEAWVNPTVARGWRTVIFKQKPDGMVYSLYASNAANHPVGQVFIGAEQNAEGPASIPVNAWTHLAATYRDGGELDLYVNGDLVSQTAMSGSVDVSGGALRIGGNPIWPEWFKGAIDEVRVYDRALSQDEIRTDMTTPVAATVPAALPQVVAGNQQVEPDGNAEPAGTAEAYPATSAGGTVRSVSIYVDSDSTAHSLFAGIYDDAAGHPGQLLAEGALDAPVAAAWNDVALPPVPLVAGTRYWIAILTPDGTLVFRDRCCTVAGHTSTETEAVPGRRALPGTWATGTVYDDGPMSAYATG